jgi:carboxypeptidase D
MTTSSSSTCLTHLNLSFGQAHPSLARSHLCKFDLNLTYPQTGGHFPPVTTHHGSHSTLQNQTQADPSNVKGRAAQKVTQVPNRDFASEVAYRFAQRREAGEPEQPLHKKMRKRAAWTADATNSSGINTQYGCDLWQEMVDYAVNYTFPWCKSRCCPLQGLR